MVLNRLTGLLVSITGAILLFWITPNHTETGDYDWLQPNTLPDILAIAAMIGGLVQFIAPTGEAKLEIKQTLRVGLLFGMAFGAVLLMEYLGFLVVAPVFALAIMLIIGERRPLWLLTGVILAPAFLWVATVVILKRPLP